MKKTSFRYFEVKVFKISKHEPVVRLHDMNMTTLKLI